MMKRHTYFLSCVAAAIGLALGGVSTGQANEQSASSSSSSASAQGKAGAMMDVPGTDSLRHRSGGIGQGGVQDMKRAASDYSTMLTFANKSGSYLADVGVSISRRQGDELFSTVTEGPILLVDLPSGRYRVEATFEGRNITRDIAVPARGHAHQVIHL